ncbi:hypothetical protein CYLTODRAFT_449826 [Cylindrobasidium torrendii FP15055 ss-10]|uniref:Uncharacterized protein n=1 Tax=Cylindrobasidium torrendii FP15055 ss-10 TaxID=1314674 RepID=A0A0D7BPV9_9AGAR|nr:hypothetical protein CYLTODRAFT_449826 [Cylindrobasidium torrendii FP15055 ss-10]
MQSLRAFRSATRIVKRQPLNNGRPLLVARFLQQDAPKKAATMSTPLLASNRPSLNFSRIYTTKSGRWRKTFLVAVGALVVACIAHRATFKQRMAVRIRMANTTVKTCYHVDRHNYQRTDFNDYISTLAYYRLLILVMEWPHRQKWMQVTEAREVLVAEDFASHQGEFDAIFAELALLPDSPKRQKFHRKMRGACRDIHSYLYDYQLEDQDSGLVDVFHIPLEEMSMDNKMAIMGLGIACHILLGTSWWYRPGRSYSASKAL